MISTYSTIRGARERRFGFGRNWKAFSHHIDAARIDAAIDSLKQLTGLEDFSGLRFLDVGSGSGLFSLAAAHLGATVHSFDYDLESVECTRALKATFPNPGTMWKVEQGSILDLEYVKRLGTFDLVYAWGVLHHTGHMHQAFLNIAPLVAPGGRLVIAIYNDQGWISRYWRAVKRGYNAHALLRAVVISAHLPYLAARWASRTLRNRRPERGMRLWTDLLDWLGGYPFEVATPESVVATFTRLGFTPGQARTCGRRHGCNEFVFARPR